MTTLSKEDVVLLMEKSKFRSWIRGEGPSNEGFFMNFATLVRADLVAENERLKADNIAFARNLKGNAATTGATYEHLTQELTATRTALAAAEARESATRAILDQVMDDIRSEAFLFDGGNGISADTEDAADNLLNQPRDDSALREMISGAIDEFVFKFKRHVGGDGEFWLHELENYADAIRALAEKAKGE